MVPSLLHCSTEETWQPLLHRFMLSSSHLSSSTFGTFSRLPSYTLFHFSPRLRTEIAPREVIAKQNILTTTCSLGFQACREHTEVAALFASEVKPNTLNKQNQEPVLTCYSIHPRDSTPVRRVLELFAILSTVHPVAGDLQVQHSRRTSQQHSL